MRNLNACLDLQMEPYIEILLVPYDESFCNRIRAANLDPCPKIRVDHFKGVVDIVQDLENRWNDALEGIDGGIRLRAPENAPKALKKFTWGDRNSDVDISVSFLFVPGEGNWKIVCLSFGVYVQIADLVLCMQFSSPCTMGYTWESTNHSATMLGGSKDTTSGKKTFQISTPMSNDIPSAIQNQSTTVEDRKKPRSKKRSMVEPQSESGLMDLKGYGSFQDMQVGKLKRQSGAPVVPWAMEKARKEKKPVGLRNLVEHREEANIVKQGKKLKSTERRPYQTDPANPRNYATDMLETARQQCRGTLQNLQNHYLMHEKGFNLPQMPSDFGHRSNNVTAQYQGMTNHEGALNARVIQDEDSIRDILMKEDSKFGVAIGEVLMLAENAEPVEVQGDKLYCTPRKDTSQANDELSLKEKIAFLSPPSSFKLPPGFQRLSGSKESNTPPKSLQNIFDSCHVPSPIETKTNNCGTKEGEDNGNLSSPYFPYSNLSLLSLLDGISNSQWIGKIEADEDVSDKDNRGTDSRPFADLFGK